MRCYFNVRSKADVSQLNLLHTAVCDDVVPTAAGRQWLPLSNDISSWHGTEQQTRCSGMRMM